jgi:hypothetical protein
MRNSSKRALRWAAPVALVGVMGLAACGDGGSAETVRTASPSEPAVGSDQHLVNQSEEIAWQVRSNQAASDRLTGQADQYDGDAWQVRSNRAASDRLTGQADQYDGDAWQVRSNRAASDRLTGQAEQYGRHVARNR